MRRYLPFFIVAAVGLLTLGPERYLYWAKRLPVDAALKSKLPP